MHFNVSYVVFKITTIDRPWYPKNTPYVSVWLLVYSSEVGVPFHYAHMPLKTDTGRKMYTCTDMMKTLRYAHRCVH